ncbi:MAG: 1-acyl-sn-glycerol-3-phosphate acyltransferase [Henriciella sp.]|nr:1-acyl-sn-glycerol-3-phosphate acyltransferase [Henriciella sp.]
MRGLLFTGVYYVLSFVYVLLSLPFLALPGRGPVTAIIRSYTRAVNIALHLVGGVKKEVRGRENLPEGAFILAPKHASWGDGFMVYPEVKNLAFVTGDHLERFPLVGGILRKLGAIVIDTCGGGERKASSLAKGMTRAREEGRRVLIYPEGHLAPVGYHFRYKPGVWHMQTAMDVPIVPVATNLNCFWNQEEIEKTPGTAVIEFLEPIPAGLPKDEALKRLSEAVETRSAELIAEATGRPVEPTRLLPDPDKGTVATPEAEAAKTA